MTWRVVSKENGYIDYIFYKKTRLDMLRFQGRRRHLNFRGNKF